MYIRGKIKILYIYRIMNRPQRTITAPKRLIEEETPEPKRTTRRTLNLDVPKVEVKQSVVQDVIDKPKVTTRKTKSGVKKLSI